MNLSKMFLVAKERKLILGRLHQVQYVMGGEHRNDSWEAHFHDEKGNWQSGHGRSPDAAVAKALGIDLGLDKKPTTYTEEEFD